MTLNLKELYSGYKLSIVGEEKREHKVYEINNRELVFNTINGRVYYELSLELGSQERKEHSANENDQKIIYKVFEKITKNNEYKQLKDDILKNGINQPLIITKNGTVVDGNTRLFFLRKLIKNGEKNIDAKIRVVVLSKTYDNSEIVNAETAIQFQFTNKISYSAINRKIKARAMHKQNIQNGMIDKNSWKDIGEKLNETYLTIKQDLETLVLMDKYVKEDNGVANYQDFEDKNNHFSQLSKALKYMNSCNFDKETIENLEKTAMHQIKNNVTLIRSFREIMPINKQTSFLINDINILNKWVYDSRKTANREELDSINFKVIEERRLFDKREKKKSIDFSYKINDHKNNLNSNINIFEIGINSLYKNINSVKEYKNQISHETINQLKEILKIIQ